MRRARLALEVLRAEGPAGFLARLRDRTGDRIRERSFRPAGHGPLAPRGRPPVVNVLATPPAPRLGGVQTQLLARMEEESWCRPFALLYPRGGRYRLEVADGAERRAADLTEVGRPERPGPPMLPGPELERAVLQAVERTGASAVHFENAAGLPLAALLRLHAAGLRLVLSLHDFALFCPRPNLIERPEMRFCRYSTDLGRCAACLANDWPARPEDQAAHRGVGRALLLAAEAVIHPSEFLRRRYLELFPGLDPDRHLAIPPAGLSEPSPLGRAVERSGRIRHVAFAGSVQPHKGAEVFAEVVRRVAPLHPEVSWSAYGGGDRDALLALRRLHRVAVRGYYRAGTLSRRLRRDRVDLVLLPSIWPETHLLTLDECVRAGVPVLAFALGAPAERVPSLGAGLLVPPEAGAEGMAAVLLDLLRDGGPPPLDPEAAGRLPTPLRAAEAHLALYRRLGLA